MECYCEPSDTDEYCSVWDVSWRVAKKKHKCCECLEPINIGERYERIFSAVFTLNRLAAGFRSAAHTHDKQAGQSAG